MRTVAMTLIAGLAVGVAGCGGSERNEEAGTPTQAIAEIGKVRRQLDAALARHRAGEREQADELVADAYLEHFEHVEGALEQADKPLMEHLEHAIATELRARIKAGAPAGEVAALVERTQQHLGDAARVLAKA